jgi:hypothetical protein
MDALISADAMLPRQVSARPDSPAGTPRQDARAREGFGRLIRRALSPGALRRLHPQIRRRFDDPSPHFAGRMQLVYCSLLGRLVATLLAPARLLPARCATDVAFEFSITVDDGKLGKRRLYQWSDGSRFAFVSKVGEQPRLHEQFGLGLGMYLRLAVEDDGSLLFADDGYFLRLGSVRLRLPGWLPGRFELMHQNLDARRFSVRLRVSNGVVGTLFYQCGEFEAAHQVADEVSRKVVHGAGASCLAMRVASAQTG